MPPVEVPEIAVRALLRRLFPGRDPISERMRSGGSMPVYRVTIGKTTAYLRLAEEPGECRDAEVRVHELLRERGVPVPRVLRFEPEPPELDRSAALISIIPGRPIGRHTPIAALRRIAHAAGQDLTAINTVLVQGYGWVDLVRGEDRHLAAEHPTRAARAVEYLAAVETVIASEVFSASQSTAMREAMRIWSDLPDAGSSRLAHGDFDATHIYADPKVHTCAGIIDFGEIRGADPLYDLRHVWMQSADPLSRTVFEHLLAGYRERGNLPGDWRGRIRLQSITTATRTLAIQLGRPPNPYRHVLIERLRTLLDTSGPSP